MMATTDLASTVPEEDVAIRALAFDRFVDMFLSQNGRAQLGLLVAATLIALVWYQSTHSLLAIAWLVLAALVAVFRFLYSEAFIRRVAPPQRVARIVSVLLVNGVLMALPLQAFAYFSELGRAALSIILLASATASVATTSGFRLVFLAFAVPMLILLSLAWCWVAWINDSGAAWGLAALIVLYLLFLVSIGRQANAVFQDLCRFRFGEQQLNRELTHALEEASEANRAKTQFLAAASHDLRQPIHSMNVLVAALSLRQLEPQSKEIVALLGTVNQTLSKQLDTLLDVSKLDAGVVHAEFAVHSLRKIVETHHAATSPVAQERGLRLELEDGVDVSASTDAALLTRALSNLTDNALKFTPRGGIVQLSVLSEQHLAVLRVRDSGIGISLDEQERVFREFYQVGNVERDRLKGLGLGLSIVRRLCALLDVQLQLESQPGVGTTITLRMPQAAPVEPVRIVARERDGFAKGLRVLVVDDEVMVRQSMRLLLTELGCLVHLAEGVDVAQSIAQAHPIDLVLSDLRLRDGASGLSVIHSIRALHPAAHAVLITGDTAPDRIREAQSAGVGLLYKPVALDDLIAVLPTAHRGAVTVH